MDTLPLFSFEELEPETQPVPMPVSMEGTEGRDGDVPEEDLVGHHAAIVEEQATDGTRTPVDLDQGSGGPEGENAGTGESRRQPAMRTPYTKARACTGLSRWVPWPGSSLTLPKRN